MAKGRRRGCWRATTLAAMLLVLSACRAPFVSGWIPHWGPSEGRAGYTGGAAGLFVEVSPFEYAAQADGTVTLIDAGSAGQLATTVTSAHANGLKVVPTVVDATPPLVMAGILADPAARANHINNLVALANSSPVQGHTFDGIDLDYEGFAFSDGRTSWPTTQPNWRAFIYELAGALGDKMLSVTVPPVWTSGGAVTGYTVYDPQWLATYADRVRFMVYDWSVSNPGPISPMSWLNSVIAWTNSQSTDPGQRQKIQLGVPAYGRDWGRQANAKETCPDGALTRKSIELQKMAAWASSHNATPIADPGGSGEMYFTYDTVVSGLRTAPIPAPTFVPPATRANTIAPATGNAGGLQPALRLTPPDQQVTCTVRHFVYYPNEYTIQAHAQAALNAGWSGIVLWALGYEIPEVYYRLGEI